MVHHAKVSTLNSMSGKQLMQRIRQLKAEEKKMIADFFAKKGNVRQKDYTRRRKLIKEEIDRTEHVIDFKRRELKQKIEKRGYTGPQRKFKGKIFTSTGTIYRKKSTAKQQAESLRKRGYKARVIKVKGGYSIFSRKLK